jgi:hypothetical protein
LTALASSHNNFGWHELIHIAPDPALPRLNRADEWMTSVLKVLGGVLVLGIVATADMPAEEAQS